MTRQKCDTCTWSGRALHLLDSVRPYQAIVYSGLVLFSLYSVIFTPTSPIVRYMPEWVRLTYIGLQGIAPCVSFYGQWVQWRYSDDSRMIENGWWVQWAADSAICWSLLVAITAFVQAEDEPSAVFVICFLIGMAVCAVLLSTRDIIRAIGIRYQRRRTREAAASES